MELYQILSILILLAASFGYINARFIKLPTAIGLMFIAIVFSLVVIGLSYFDDTLYKAELALIREIDFEEVVMDYMLSFLLFAGALHTHFHYLRSQRWPILLFATLGTLTSTFLVGTAVYFLLGALDLEVKYTLCLLFGALISPTDPIAVLGILKKANVPKKLETKIVGESLFNDGVGVVIFLTLFGIAAKGEESIHPWEIVHLFGLEVIGGLGLGLFIGWVAFLLMKSIDDFSIEILITLAAVMGGTVIAQKLHVSAPLAMVAAGLVVGNDRARSVAMSDLTERYVDKFWGVTGYLIECDLVCSHRYGNAGAGLRYQLHPGRCDLYSADSLVPLCFPLFTGQALREETGFCSQNHADYDLGRFKGRYFDRPGLDAYSGYAAGYVFDSHLHCRGL